MKELIPVLSALMGRDVSKEIAALAEARAALGTALSVDQQLFVSAHWHEIALWFASEPGKETARFAVDEWAEWVIANQTKV